MILRFLLLLVFCALVTWYAIAPPSAEVILGTSFAYIILALGALLHHVCHDRPAKSTQRTEPASSISTDPEVLAM